LLSATAITGSRSASSAHHAHHSVSAQGHLLQEHSSSADEMRELIYAEMLSQLAERGTAEEATACADVVERETGSDRMCGVAS